MSQRITFVLDAFREGVPQKDSEALLEILLDALTKVCAYQLAQNPDLPGPYQRYADGRPVVLYKEEPPGAEDWDDVPTSLDMGVTDCETLACWQAAYLIVREGEDARAVYSREQQADGTWLYHIVVRRADGTIQDPSRDLGMR